MADNKTDIILNAAEELMCASSDPTGITVDMIARKAGIGKGSIYYYFKSKEEITDAVIERCYTLGIREYFESIREGGSTLDKIKMLFQSMLREEFRDSSKNILLSLHLRDDIIVHQKLMMTAIKTLSPILCKLLEEGRSDGSIHTDTPRESSEMIVAMLTFLLDNTIFPSDNESMQRKLKLYSQVLETCLRSEKGSFDFLYTPFNGLGIVRQ